MTSAHLEALPCLSSPEGLLGPPSHTQAFGALRSGQGRARVVSTRGYSGSQQRETLSLSVLMRCAPLGPLLPQIPAPPPERLLSPW